MNAIINGKEIDTYSIDDEIICPHCGHVHNTTLKCLPTRI